MIAPAAPRTRVSRILGEDGRQLVVPIVSASMQRARERSERPAMAEQIDASYDAARTTSEHAQYWAHADAHDADSANSRNVRHTLVKRSRYETGSNGFVDGIYQTHANYVIGKRGPRIKIQHPNQQFRDEVAKQWNSWCKRIQFRRKLWCMAHAKIQDGEAFAVLRANDKLRHKVKLDLCLVETEQVQTPQLPWGVTGYIDGIFFDNFGNPVWYDILPYHPGGQNRSFLTNEPEHVHARYVLHWFSLRRPGQHRGVPELKSTLNVGASCRRFREATVGAAETAADFSLLMKTQLNPNSDADLDPVRPFSSIPVRKSTMAALPQGWEPYQMQAQHPNASYREFIRAQISEQARPKHMPHNLAAADSSDHSYASGRLDFQPYYMGVDNERSDCDDLVLDNLFEEWYLLAGKQFGWFMQSAEAPDRTWHWGPHPAIDQAVDAAWKASALQNGTVTISALYAADGEDFEEVLEQMSRDYGVSIDEMRRLIRVSIFNAAQQQSSMFAAGNRGGMAGAGPPPAPGSDWKDRLGAAVREHFNAAPAIAAYSDDQKRDENGRFARGGSARSAKTTRKSSNSIERGRSSVAKLATNISGQAYSAAPLNPSNMRSPIVVKEVGGRQYVLDGRRRIAGIIKFAQGSGRSVSDFHVPTIVVRDEALAAAASSRSRSVRENALAEIHRQSGSDAPRRRVGERLRDLVSSIVKSRPVQGAKKVIGATIGETASEAIAAKLTGKPLDVKSDFRRRLSNNAKRAVATAVGVDLNKLERQASRAKQRDAAAEAKKQRAFERQARRDAASSAQQERKASSAAASAARRAERDAKAVAKQASAAQKRDLATQRAKARIAVAAAQVAKAKAKAEELATRAEAHREARRAATTERAQARANAKSMRRYAQKLKKRRAKKSQKTAGGTQS